MHCRVLAPGDCVHYYVCHFLACLQQCSTNAPAGGSTRSMVSAFMQAWGQGGGGAGGGGSHGGG